MDDNGFVSKARQPSVRAPMRLCWIVGALFVAFAPPATQAATPSVEAPTAFDAQTPPPAPDYADTAAWAVLPGGASLAREAPAGKTSTADDAGVDVFYIHPTTYNTHTRWNQDVADAETNVWTDVSVVARQASIFNGCCRIFAPRYRQASSAAFGPADGDKAYALAYQDVKRAFEYYLAHYNQGRPFILAGHSQGALHIYRLIADEIDGKPLQARFVAAYAIGVPISLNAFGALYTSVKPCLKPLQTGCIVSWNTRLASAAPAFPVARPPQAYVGAYTAGGVQDVLCINPLTFDAGRPDAPAADNPGSLVWPPAAEPLRPLIVGAVGAACRHGVLIATPAPGVSFKLDPLPGGSLHMQDMDLFYQAIRDNAAARAAAFAPQDGGAKPLDGDAALRDEIWTKEQAIYKSRGTGSLNTYIDNTSSDYLGWPPFAKAPFGAVGLKATRSRVAAGGERLTMALEGFTRSGDTAVIYYATHLSATADGKPADQTYENVHVWTREDGAWRLLGGMARIAPARAQ